MESDHEGCVVKLEPLAADVAHAAFGIFTEEAVEGCCPEGDDDFWFNDVDLCF